MVSPHALPSRRAAHVVLRASCAGAAQAATTPGEAKDVTLRLSAVGTVAAIDPAARQLTLKGERGLARYRIDPKVDRLDQVKVGERVKVDYVAAMVLTLKRGGRQMQEQVEGELRARSEPGQPVALGTTVVTRVLAVDRAAQTVRLKGPQGRVGDFRVQDQADLVGVRAGDQVVAVLHEAVVVGLEPASK